MTESAPATSEGGKNGGKKERLTPAEMQQREMDALGSRGKQIKGWEKSIDFSLELEKELEKNEALRIQEEAEDLRASATSSQSPAPVEKHTPEENHRVTPTLGVQKDGNGSDAGAKNNSDKSKVKEPTPLTTQVHNKEEEEAAEPSKAEAIVDESGKKEKTKDGKASGADASSEAPKNVDPEKDTDSAKTANREKQTVDTKEHADREAREKIIAPIHDASLALARARRQAEKETIGNLTGPLGLGAVQRFFARHGFFGGANEETIAQNKKVKACEANLRQETEKIESALDTRARERLEKKLETLSDADIRTRLIKRGMRVGKEDDVDANRKAREQYAALMRGKLEVMKAPARFHSIYMPQMLAARDDAIEQAPEKEKGRIRKALEWWTGDTSTLRSRQRHNLKRALIWSGTGGAAILATGGLAASGIATGYIGIRLTRGLATGAVGGEAAFAAAKVTGHITERNIERRFENQVEAARTGYYKAKKSSETKTRGASAMSALFTAMEDMERGKKRKGLYQGGAALVFGGAAGLGTYYGLDAYGNTSSSSATSKITPFSSASSTPSHDPGINEAIAEAEARAEARDDAARYGSPVSSGMELERGPVVLEGTYEGGSSITREIDQWLAREHPELAPEERGKVAWRLAHDVITESKTDPEIAAALQYQGDTPNIVYEEAPYRIALDPAKVQEHIVEITGRESAPVGAVAEATPEQKPEPLERVEPERKPEIHSQVSLEQRPVHTQTEPRITAVPAQVPTPEHGANAATQAPQAPFEVVAAHHYDRITDMLFGEDRIFGGYTKGVDTQLWQSLRQLPVWDLVSHDDSRFEGDGLSPFAEGWREKHRSTLQALAGQYGITLDRSTSLEQFLRTIAERQAHFDRR